MKINIFLYIADKNLEQAMNFVKGLGYPDPKAKNDSQLKFKIAGYLADFYKRNVNDPQTIIDIVNLHPDKSIIQKALMFEQEKNKQPVSQPVSQPEKSQADGCPDKGKWSNCAGCAFVNADAAPVAPASKLSQQNINLIIIGGSLTLLAGLIATIYFANKKSK